MKKKISLAEAKERVKRYRENAQKNSNGVKMPNCIDFDLNTINNIIKNPKVKGVRAYFTQNEDDLLSLFLVGYNEAEEDVLPVSVSSLKTTMQTTGLDAGEIDDPTKVCPPVCNNSIF